MENHLPEKVVALGTARSEIRELFEFGKKRAAVVGPENVFDFSLGNPSVPPPDCVNEAAVRMLQTADSLTLHGYTSAQGDTKSREAYAADINRRFGTNYTADQFYITVEIGRAHV